MSPRRKSYAVAEAVIASDPDLDPIVARFDDQPGRPPQEFDFDEYADFPHLFRAFAGAFRRHHDAAQRVTREGAFGGIRKFFAFLREQRAAGMAIVEPGDLTTELLQAYAAWLQRRSLGLRSQAHYYGITVRILGELRRSRPALFGHVVVPRRQFPGVGRQRRLHPMPKLTAPTMRALREAAWKEVQAVWTDFCRGQTLLAEAIERLGREQRPPDPRNLGELLVLIEREHGGASSAVRRGERKAGGGLLSEKAMLSVEHGCLACSAMPVDFLTEDQERQLRAERQLRVDVAAIGREGAQRFRLKGWVQRPPGGYCHSSKSPQSQVRARPHCDPDGIALPSYDVVVRPARWPSTSVDTI